MAGAYNNGKNFIVPECAFCSAYRGLLKCRAYPNGIPQELLAKSFPGTPRYDENYCRKKSLQQINRVR